MFRGDKNIEKSRGLRNHVPLASAWSSGPSRAILEAADAFVEAGRIDQAIDFLEGALRERRDAGRGHGYTPAADALYNYLEQLRHAKSVGDGSPRHLTASRKANEWAEELLRRRMSREAAAYLKATFPQPTSDFRVLNNLGMVCYEQDRLDEALEYFLKSLFLHPAFPDALSNAMLIAFLLRRVREIIPYLHAAKAARAAAKKHSERNGSNGAPPYSRMEDDDTMLRHLGEAEAALEEGLPESAIPHLLEALIRNPMNPRTLHALAFITHGKKDYALAHSLNEAAAVLSGEEPAVENE
jgi:tetratricopeptide (TPR) repeat protein